MDVRDRCKACKDELNPDAEWRRDCPKSDMYSPGNYCRTCYMELVAGVLPNACQSLVVKDSLVYRQAMKKH